MSFAVSPASTLRWYQLQIGHIGYLALGCSMPGAEVFVHHVAWDLHCLPKGPWV